MEEAKRITTQKPEGFFKKYGFYIALIVLLGIIACPTPDGLSIAGQRMLGIMVFSVIVWATTAISYPVSAGVIIALMAVLIGFAPNPTTGKIFGTPPVSAWASRAFPPQLSAWLPPPCF